MKLSEFTHMISTWGKSQLLLCFIKYVKEMKARGMEDDIRAVIKTMIDEDLYARLSESDDDNEDLYVAHIRRVITEVSKRSRRSGDYLSVFKHRERERINNLEFISLHVNYKDPPRASSTTRVYANNLLKRLGYDLYIYTETYNRGYPNCYTVVWLDRHPR